jgi:hypothetical protein
MPDGPQHEATEGKDVQPMVTGITDEQVAGADADSVWIEDLARTGADATKAGNRVEPAGAGIEAPEEPGRGVEQVDAAIGRKGNVTRNGEPAEATVRLAQGASGPWGGSEREARSVGHLLDALEEGVLPADPSVQQPPGRIIGRPRDGWKEGGAGHGSVPSSKE